MLLDERSDDTLMIEREPALDVRRWFRASVIEPFELMQQDDAERVEISAIVSVVGCEGTVEPERRISESSVLEKQPWCKRCRLWLETQLVRIQIDEQDPDRVSRRMPLGVGATGWHKYQLMREVPLGRGRQPFDRAFTGFALRLLEYHHQMDGRGAETVFGAFIG